MLGVNLSFSDRWHGIQRQSNPLLDAGLGFCLDFCQISIGSFQCGVSLHNFLRPRDSVGDIQSSPSYFRMKPRSLWACDRWFRKGFEANRCLKQPVTTYTFLMCSRLQFQFQLLHTRWNCDNKETVCCSFEKRIYAGNKARIDVFKLSERLIYCRLI